MVILGFPAFAQQEAKTNKVSRPNVILILTDDMGYGDLGCYGGFPYRTPNINRLANQGMRFTSF
ncbi:sulfatase-like hydrolase/transferase, partial [Rhizobium leguminosarum]|uniref:sulfatase-like hydrolase/transferase n=1 Tax=Rhizobium leguminosarum TaxID=384 RepID=UPI003F959FAF